MTVLILSLALLVAAGCSGPAPEPAPAEKLAAAPAERIRDETHKFHKTGLVEARVVESNLGGKDFMPGGNLAEYEKDGKKYQVFFSLRRNAQQATFLATDYRDILSDTKYISQFGGFFGMDGETPTLVFPRNRYVIVIAGLDFEDADMAGRMIAAYLN